LVDGEDLTPLGPAERLRKGIFLTFQMVPDFEGLRVFDILQVLGISPAEASPLLDSLGMGRAFLQRELKGLSGGERKKLELIQAFLSGKKYVLLDEVDSGVDAESLAKIYRLVEEMASSGRAVLLVSHNPSAPAHRVVMLKGGVLLENGGKP
jgi:Fe-S cluster assembly ATP-binding protein